MQRGLGLLLVFVLAACSSAPGPGPARDDVPLAPPPVAPAPRDPPPAPADAAVVVDAAAPPADAAPARVRRPPRPRNNHGAICQLGERRRSSPDPGRLPRVETCGPGLECCYPCGIQGCDWVCHTPQECAVDRTRP